MKSKLEIYALAVCFAAVVCLVITSGIAGYSLIGVAAPEFTIDKYDYDRHLSNDKFFKQTRTYGCKDKCDNERPTEEVLTKNRLESYQVELSGERRNNFQTLIQCFMFLAVSIVALWVHWRIAKNSRAT